MKPSVLFYVLDSATWDHVNIEHTPNFDSVGALRKAHSPACFTTASMVAYFIGIPPIGAGEPMIFPGVGRDSFPWIPSYYETQGYETAWLSCNPHIIAYDMVTNGSFSRGFQHFEAIKYYGEWSSKVQNDIVLGMFPSVTREITQDAIDILKETTKPVFMTILEMATHMRYFDGQNKRDFDPNNPDKNNRDQRAAVKYADKMFGILLEHFSNRPTVVIVTSDHGELMGPTHWGHNPKYHYKFKAGGFAIPYVKGVLP